MKPVASSARAPRVLLGVSAGIAAYKSVELVRLLRKAGCAVQVVMTRHATRLVGPETFRSLSGRPVALELFPKKRSDVSDASDLSDRTSIPHIDLAAWADLVVVAPATANVIAKLSHGLADDLLSTLLLAVPASLRAAGRFILAPAMNVNMWRAPSVAANVRVLAGQGWRIVGPEKGELACGTTGPGRMAEPPVILRACLDALAPRRAARGLAGRNVLVTAGPTEEPFDPVRVVTNRSSGRMGIALAEACRRAGALVELVCGPVAVPLPEGVAVKRVRTSRQMQDAVLGMVGAADVLLMCAAVSDYRPARVLREKTHGATLRLALVRTADILEAVSRTRHHALVIGFSLDPSAAAARRKLAAKRLDLVVANDYSTPGSDTIKATLFAPDAKPRALPRMSKERFAERLAAVVADALEKRSPRPTADGSRLKQAARDQCPGRKRSAVSGQRSDYA